MHLWDMHGFGQELRHDDGQPHARLLLVSGFGNPRTVIQRL